MVKNHRSVINKEYVSELLSLYLSLSLPPHLSLSNFIYL